MELTKAQEKVLLNAKKTIDKSRQFNDFESYYQATYNRPVPDDEREYSFYKNCWEKNCAGMPLVSASTSTLKALVKKGFVEIINVGGNFPDRIKVLNY